MAPAIPCSFGIVTLSTKTTFCLRKEIPLATSNAHQRSSRVPGSCGKHFWLQPESLRLLQKHGGYCISNHVPRLQPLAAIGADVAMEEQTPVVSSASGENSIEASPAATSEKDVVTSPIDAPTAPSKRTGSTRKSETPRLKDDDLVPGATFMGKVVRIQPFGAFVDFGAFTNGLVHISNLSDSFVKDVGSVVSVGQEVEVRLLDVNMETKRISLTMCSERETFNNDEGQQTRSRRRNMSRSDLRRRGAGKHSKFEGELFDGTVKTLGRSGSIITLSDGREGFLPLSEESDTLDSVVGSSSLQVGDEVRVRILRTSRGQLVFTMKRRKKKGPKGGATFKEPVSNKTFSVLFRQNLEIASFLDEREQMQRQVQEVVLEGAEEVVEASSLESQGPSLGEPAPEAGSDEFVSIEESIPEASSKVSAESEEMKTSDSVPIESSAMTESYKIDEIEPSADNDNPNSTPSTSDSAVAEVAAITTESVPLVDSAVSMEGVSRDANPISSNIEDSVTVLNLVVESISETVSEKEDASMVESGTKNDSVIRNDAYSVMLDEAKPEMGPTIKTEQNVTPELVVPEDINTDPSSGASTDEKFIGSELSIAYVDEEVTSDSGETNSVISSGQDKSKMANSTTAIILPALVKKLREETGAGMMDCKNALVEMGCDIAKAQEFLRKKGLASAEKRAGKVTEEGQIGSYVHDSRIGVMIEVNCETDFVSRGEIFKELVQDLAMQVAACPQVQYLVPEDVPEEVVNKEREIEMQKEDLQSKPEQFRSKIVDGRINKRLQELALLEQPYIKNDKLVVKDLVKQAIASVGENIKVKRFVRFNLGEGLEKRNESFAAEVAAQTSSKTSSSPPVSIQEPVEANEVKEKAPVVVVSAALVKQLREETGAGMMDCKKALAESEGVLEKAHDYLRKKGIASAAKKSSRITAEGRVASYIHDSRIGALIEVNSETDFVARNEKFKELVNDLAMQVVACPQVEFVSVEEISENVVTKEREIEMQREDIQSKPEHIREKIVEGRISKRLAELALLEQPFIKDDSLLVKDLISQTVAALGENIKIRRFARFTLGE